MEDLAKYNDILIELRNHHSYGGAVTEDVIKILKNRYKSKIKESDKEAILDRLIAQSKADLIEFHIGNLKFSKLKAHMELVDTINVQFRNPEQAERYSASKAAFDAINKQIRTGQYDQGSFAPNISAIEKDAKAWENIDKQHKLFETLRKYAKSCETFVLSVKDPNARMVLLPELAPIVLNIQAGVPKIGFNVFMYRDLSEKCAAENDLREIPFQKRFPTIITLIGLRCRELSIPVPATITMDCPLCGEKISPNLYICSSCGGVVKCDSCGVAIKQGEKNCKGCGKKTDDIKLSVIKRNEELEKIEEIKTETDSPTPPPKKPKNKKIWIFLVAGLIIGGVVLILLRDSGSSNKEATVSELTTSNTPSDAEVSVPGQSSETSTEIKSPSSAPLTTPDPKKKEAQRVTAPAKSEPATAASKQTTTPAAAPSETQPKQEANPDEMSAENAYQAGKNAAKKGTSAKAAKYYQSAADRGVAAAAYDLALLYQKGDGVAQSAPLAFKYMKIAADANYTSAFRLLGEMYHGGRGVAKDRALAEQWYKKAADLGDEKAKKLLYKM